MDKLIILATILAELAELREGMEITPRVYGDIERARAIWKAIKAEAKATEK